MRAGHCSGKKDASAGAFGCITRASLRNPGFAIRPGSELHESPIGIGAEFSTVMHIRLTPNAGPAVSLVTPSESPVCRLSAYVNGLVSVGGVGAWPEAKAETRN
jgi:hypothetical protein